MAARDGPFESHISRLNERLNEFLEQIPREIIDDLDNHYSLTLGAATRL